MHQYLFRSLKADDNVSDFDCGDNDLNEFLKYDALNNQNGWLSATHVLCDGEKIIGFFTLVADTLQKDKIAEADRVDEYSYPKYSCIKLARLAVDKAYQGCGVGTELMIYAFAVGRKIVLYEGGKFFTVDAKNTAVGFYKKIGFVPVRSQKAAETVSMYADFPLVFERTKE